MKLTFIYIFFILMLSCNVVFAEQIIPQNILKSTIIITAPLSGEKGKTYFICPSGKKCSTENVVKAYFESKGYNVMRAEVVFWQGMFALAFYDEIFAINTNDYNDIPLDMFDDSFYINRKNIIDKKYNFLKSADISKYINKQLAEHKDTNTRLLDDAPIENSKNCIYYFQTPIVQKFLIDVNPKNFAKIVYHIANNPNYNRAGIPDFVVWNEKEMILVEVKREKEKLREKQILWLEYLIKNNIKCNVVRVKGIKRIPN